MFDAKERLERRRAQCPLIAILRGVTPESVEEVGEALVEAGFAMIEVPLNSPRAFDSIERLAMRFGDVAMIGAGTVTALEQVSRLRDAGGELLVSPHCDVDLIEAGVKSGLVVLPGVFTPSEAFAALRAGAHALKLFPAELASPQGLRAMATVLPPSTPLFAVGGVTPLAIAEWQAAGAGGFGLGSALYRPGKPIAAIAADARAFVAAAQGEGQKR